MCATITKCNGRKLIRFITKGEGLQQSFVKVVNEIVRDLCIYRTFVLLTVYLQVLVYHSLSFSSVLISRKGKHLCSCPIPRSV